MATASVCFSAKSDQIGRAGEYYVAAEILRRGGYAVTFSGNMPGTDILASDVNQTRQIGIQVKTKGPGSTVWQTSTARARKAAGAAADAEVHGRFWVLVDLRTVHPEFYVMPEWWALNNIYEKHQDYLQSHGGVRPGNPMSTHHAITKQRVEEWRERWSELRILRLPSKDD